MYEIRESSPQVTPAFQQFWIRLLVHAWNDARCNPEVGGEGQVHSQKDFLRLDGG